MFTVDYGDQSLLSLTMNLWIAQQFHYTADMQKIEIPNIYYEIFSIVFSNSSTMASSRGLCKQTKKEQQEMDWRFMSYVG